MAKYFVKIYTTSKSAMVVVNGDGKRRQGGWARKGVRDGDWPEFTRFHNDHPEGFWVEAEGPNDALADVRRQGYDLTFTPHDP